MKHRQTLAFFVGLAVCVGCDQTTKQIAVDSLDGSVISLAGDAVRFQLAYNPGAFLSLGAGLPAIVRDVLFLLVVPLAMALVCVAALRIGLGSGGLLGVALVAGGGLGNWLDRLLHGGVVTDFVSLGLGPFRTGIFNVADVCVVAGIVLLLACQRGRARDQAGGESL